MKKLHLSILINATPEKVWNTIIGKDTYPLWTEVFSVGSNVQGSWEKGGKMLFTGPEEDGTFGGMVSEIAENKPYEFLSIKHVGVLKHGVEDRTSEEVKKWLPSFENYTLKKINDTTELTIDMDTDESMEEYFANTWPKALERLKEVAQTGTSHVIATLAFIKAPLEKVWAYYTEPTHITQWAFASDDWEAPYADNDLKVGGRFKTTMASKDGKNKFDITGTYTKVESQKSIEYTMDGDDHRKVSVEFQKRETTTQVTVVFDMENENTRELQFKGWQEILNNFKKHVETF